MTARHHRVEQLLQRHSPLQMALLSAATLAICAVLAVAAVFWVQGG